MHLSGRLDVDLVAVEKDDELTLLVELTAASRPAGVDRAPATLQIVLDRSGSMRGDRLDGAKAALLALVDRLDPEDNLGIVAFDDRVQVVVPAGPLVDKDLVKQAIVAVRPGGSTDLSGGYLRGLQEAQRVAGDAGATVLLISDGHANAGVVDPVRLGAVAAQARAAGVTTSTIGFGLGYDERLLAALAAGGSGNELFAEQADAAVALIAGEVQGLLDQVAQAVSLRIGWTAHVAGATVLNDVPVAATATGLTLELGSFYAGETRRLLMTLLVPGIAALGLAQVATVELTSVSLPDLVQSTTSLPVHVNVVPGDIAAGRIPDPHVRSEALFQRTQQTKRESSRLLSQGRVAEASDLLSATSRDLLAQLSSLPPEVSGELTREAGLLRMLADEAHIDSSRAAKASSMDSSRKSRTRGRASSGAGVMLRLADDVDGSGMLHLQEWEVVRLARLLPDALRRALLPAAGHVHGQEIALQIAAVVADTHELRPFFEAAATSGGFAVESA